MGELWFLSPCCLAHERPGCCGLRDDPRTEQATLESALRSKYTVLSRGGIIAFDVAGEQYQVRKHDDSLCPHCTSTTAYRLTLDPQRCPRLW